jgi:hypothetical protein
MDVPTLNNKRNGVSLSCDRAIGPEHLATVLVEEECWKILYSS